MAPSSLDADDRWPFSSHEWQSIVERLTMSPKQADLVRGLMQSKPRRVIQRELDISASTFRTQFDRVRAKLGAEDAMAIALRVFKTFRDLNS